MKKFIPYFVMLILLPFATARDSRALLPVGLYVGARGTADTRISSRTSAIDLEPGFIGSGSFIAGLRLFSFRVDLEYALGAFRTNDIDISILGHSLLGNVYYNLFDSILLKLYLNGGAGRTTFAHSSLLEDEAETFTSSFTWLVGAGVTFSLFNVVNLDIGYRFMDFGNPQLDYCDDDWTSSTVYLALRFGF
ncbi:MAG: hypothetical protein LBU15_04405 [Rickettsiales bacterium]|nr:hypothetical protein [Rickettsiales bacterium]